MKITTLRQNLTCARPTRTIQRPRAILFINDDAFAGVCAWCSDKKEADAWCLKQGFVATHSICPACRARFQAENDPVDHRHVA